MRDFRFCDYFNCLFVLGYFRLIRKMVLHLSEKPRIVAERYGAFKPNRQFQL